jgi:ABC-type sugar transport system substrate-binding protein
MQLRNRWRAAVAALAICTLGLAACNRGDDTASSGGGSGAEQITVGAVSGSAANPAVQVMNDAMKQRAQEKGVKLLVETSENVEEQIEKAEAMIAQGVTYLGLHPWDGAAVVPLIQSAKAKGVKVVILIDGVPGVENDTLTFISGNELAAAEKIGQWVVQNHQGASEAAIITGTPGNLSAETRTNGFKKGIEGSGVKVVAEGTGNWARDEALRVAGDMLTANPNLNVLFANNDEMAFGALTAAKEAGKADKIDMIGWNGTCIGLKALLDGDFKLEAVLPFDDFGAGLIDAATDDAAGTAVQKTIEPEVPVLTTEDAKAILDGSQQASEALVAGLKQASEGNCG